MKIGKFVFWTLAAIGLLGTLYIMYNIIPQLFRMM